MEKYVNMEMLAYLLPVFINVLCTSFAIGTVFSFFMFGFMKAFRLLNSYKQT